MKIQGKSLGTRLLHTMRQMRGAYMENVRAGRCEMDAAVLKEFDTNLKDAHERYRHQAVSPKQ